MKTIYLFTIILLVACSTPEEITTTFPDFSDCNCEITYEPICGEDGYTYLNECLMNCKNVDSISNGNCADVFFEPHDTLTWPIERVCIPIQTSETAQLDRVLSDGSAIYIKPDGSYFRGNQNMCVCLATHTKIATPLGQIPVSELSQGDMVWTLNELGKKVAKPIRKVQHVKVGTNHMMLNIRLKDGRYLKVSALHPNSEGIPLSKLSKGDSLEGSEIINLYYTHYQDSVTWDLLPASMSGVYWANDILLGSTMKEWKGDLPF